MSDRHLPLTTEGERFSSPPRALEYLAQDAPGIGAAQAIVAGVDWLRIPLPMELNHINLWLLDDEPGWTLVDTGMAEQVCRDAWTAIERDTLRGRRIARIVITHDHPDHVGLAPWLAEKHGAEVWMSSFAHGSMSDYLHASPGRIHARLEVFLRSHGLPLAVDSPVMDFDHRRWFGSVPVLSHSLGAAESLLTGALRWQVIETAGHCGGHLCLYDADGGVLISGDQVLPTISSNVSVLPSKPDANPLGEFLASIARLSELPADTVVLPSHGRPFHGLHRRLLDLRLHHEQQLDAVVAVCSEPRSAIEVLPTMFGRVMRGFHRIMALGEAVAHLHYLREAGRVQRVDGADGVIRWAAVPSV